MKMKMKKTKANNTKTKANNTKTKGEEMKKANNTKIKANKATANNVQQKERGKEMTKEEITKMQKMKKEEITKAIKTITGEDFSGNKKAAIKHLIAAINNNSDAKAVEDEKVEDAKDAKAVEDEKVEDAKDAKVEEIEKEVDIKSIVFKKFDFEDVRKSQIKSLLKKKFDLNEIEEDSFFISKNRRIYINVDDVIINIVRGEIMSRIKKIDIDSAIAELNKIERFEKIDLGLSYHDKIKKFKSLFSEKTDEELKQLAKSGVITPNVAICYNNLCATKAQRPITQTTQRKRSKTRSSNDVLTETLKIILKNPDKTFKEICVMSENSPVTVKAKMNLISIIEDAIKYSDGQEISYKRKESLFKSASNYAMLKAATTEISVEEIIKECDEKNLSASISTVKGAYTFAKKIVKMKKEIDNQ